MDKAHPSFPQPEDVNIKVWRYMDLAKLIHLLETRTLYLSRIDCLEDKHEGSIPVINYFLNKLQLQNLGIASEAQSKLEITMTKTRKAMRLTTYVNCWHMNDQESSYMWRLYGATQGIAIQTTYKKISECDDESLGNLFIGKVNYLDFKNELAKTNGNLLDSFMRKHFSFKDEHEVRILHCNFSFSAKDTNNNIISDLEEMRELNPNGLSINIKPETLIENIYVNAYAPEWYYEVVKATVAKYLPTIPVKWSNYKSPIYF